MKELLFAAATKVDWSLLVNTVFVPLGVFLFKKISSVLRKIDSIDERLRLIEKHLGLLKGGGDTEYVRR